MTFCDPCAYFDLIFSVKVEVTGIGKDHAEELDTSLSPVFIGGQPRCNLRFADDIDLPGGSEEELQQLIEMRKKTATGYGMEISSDESDILVSSIKPGPSTNIRINANVFEEVD